MQLSYPTELPITSYREPFLELLENNQVIIVSGETGSGKTTQLPKFCLESFSKYSFLIGCTQPRRVAATSVSSRVATELEPRQNLVGYKIRFHDKTTRFTRIKFMTDGVLLAETRKDPLLKSYGVIIIDEAHERSLNIDFLLGYLKNILPVRPDLKLIITSATIDTEIFSHHFDNAPVMAVEGRSYPVEVHYHEPQEKDTSLELSYVDQCVQTMVEMFRDKRPEDTLIFLPTEKDIRECCSQLESALPGSQVLPMYGRLAAVDQKRIFKPSPLPKIVVATNVAETSITVPGIRYVIDSGLARISCYNVRARTTSLPVTRISRASADQRKGRCGRVGPGVCIRLYSEEDYLDRDQYTLPEIKRSNLAAVILQMISMKLGNPFDFPFIEPPHPAAIKDGYNLLKELGALNEHNTLNSIGKLMADLPIDPPISRILIAARENNCVREIKIIAPALAIQDPRIRPVDKETLADAAQKKFAHKHSDFLSLLSIWDLFHNDGGQKRPSWGKLKKFCKTHYLSFQRMREWIDLHEQLSKILDREKGFDHCTTPASYSAIHKSLCTGFLRNIGLKKEKEKQKKLYQGAGGKEFMIFPGSHQFHNSGKWIIGATFLATNRLYALTVANIEVDWLIDASNHLNRRSWHNPRWQKKSGQVVADEKVSLFGLLLSADEIVNFGRTTQKNRKEARQIFIQDGLLENAVPGNFPFLQKNIVLLKKWQSTEERLRKRDLLVDEASLHRFYDHRLPPSVYDRFTLKRFLERKKDSSFLEMKEDDILSRRPEEQEWQDFPKYLHMASHKLGLSYNLRPGEENDGVTVRIPFESVEIFSESSFEWLVPGLIREKVMFLLKGLPKRIRKHLVPINNTADLLLDNCKHYEGSLYHALERGIFKMFQLSLSRSDWPQQLPPHLTMRFLLFDNAGRTVATGRSLHTLKHKVIAGPQKKITPNDKTTQSLACWQNKLFTEWNFDTLERRIPLFTSKQEVAGYLYPALHVEKNRGGVTLSFESNLKKASQLNVAGSLYLYQLHFKDQFKSLKKYYQSILSAPSSQWLVHQFANKTKTTEALTCFVMRSLFNKELEIIPTKSVFDAEVENIRKLGLYRKGKEICDELFKTLRKRRDVSDHIARFSTLAQKSNTYNQAQYEEYQSLLEAILPSAFLHSASMVNLAECSRYFQALMIRIERAHANPAKDRAKADQLTPFLDRLKKIPEDWDMLPCDCRNALELYRNMVNDFRVILFAPELKGGLQVSPKKLAIQWQLVQALCPGI